MQLNFFILYKSRDKKEVKIQCVHAGPQYLVWEAEGLRQFADLTQSAEILV